MLGGTKMKYEISKRENTSEEIVNIIQNCLGIRGTSVVEENDLRLLLLEIETHELIKFKSDFIIDGSMNLGEQLYRIKKAKYGDIDDVIETLNRSWNISISEPFM